MPELITVHLKETPPPPPPGAAVRLLRTYLCVVEQRETAAHPGSIPTCSGSVRWAGTFHGRRATCS